MYVYSDISFSGFFFILSVSPPLSILSVLCDVQIVYIVSPSRSLNSNLIQQPSSPHCKHKGFQRRFWPTPQNYSRVPAHKNWQIETADWNLASFLHCALETCWHYFGQFLDYFFNGFLNDFLCENLDFLYENLRFSQ